MSNFDQGGGRDHQFGASGSFTKKSSKQDAQSWLLSKNKFQSDLKLKTRSKVFKRLKGKAKTISISSGKGGVGKTSISVKFGRMLASQGYKVLLVDCDYNLSNTSVKLGIPVEGNFLNYVEGRKSFADCLYTEGNFHLFAACNGNIEIFKSDRDYSCQIINILVQQEKDYDFILLDCPAGISRESLTINAYCDYRFVIVTPDKSSITDSYSMIKILKNVYGVHDNHLIVNKSSSSTQFKRLVKSLSETVENFLSCRLHVLGAIEYLNSAIDEFDGLLFKEENSALHKTFVKVLQRFTEEIDVGENWGVDVQTFPSDLMPEQEVQPSSQCS